MMPKPLDHYIVNTANWRRSLQSNRRKTVIVISAFFAIYIALGLLIDLSFYTSVYPDLSLGAIFKALVTLKLTPFATIITCLVALISLWITFTFHNKLMLLGAKSREITPDTAKTLEEKQLYNVVEEMKVAAGLHFMPRVFLIDAEYCNAFASGYSEKSAMVAITAGLLKKLSRDELQAVMAHELSHIRHMDIRLTLMASVLANLLLIFIDIMFYNVVFGRSRRTEGGGAAWVTIAIIALRVLLPLITVLLMLFLSRTREYMADAGCVELMRTNEPLARALLKIEQDHQNNKEQYQQAYQQTAHESVRREAYIFDPVKAGIKSKSSISDFFSTHPGMKKRLAAIGFTLK